MIHHVYANRSNIGDWLAAKAIQQLLAPLKIRDYLCDEPFIEKTLDELSRVNAGDLVVVGGGGLLMDYFAPLWRGLRQLVPRLNICIWGVGYCDLKAEQSHPPLEDVKHVIANAPVCVVRDELTRRYLETETCIDAPVACPSLSIVYPAPMGRAVLHVDNYTTVGADAYETMNDICRTYASDTNRAYYQTNNRIQPGNTQDLARILSLYERADFVVSSGLHGCIIAAAMGRPVVAVSGDRKIDAFMSVAGLGRWMVEPSEVHRLEELLPQMPEQPLAAVSEFVVRARMQNAALADKIKCLYVGHRNEKVPGLE